MGIIEGGWDTVWLVYGVSWATLIGYGVSLIVRAKR